jgi:hypothetical protein
MIESKDIILLAIAQFFSILLIWARMESRLARLEGEFKMFCEMIQKTINSLEKRH